MSLVFKGYFVDAYSDRTAQVRKSPRRIPSAYGAKKGELLIDILAFTVDKDELTNYSPELQAQVNKLYAAKLFGMEINAYKTKVR
ncbi:hypothetical protein QYM36_001585, partial [Artemia franciscana]